MLIVPCDIEAYLFSIETMDGRISVCRLQKNIYILRLLENGLKLKYNYNYRFGTESRNYTGFLFGIEKPQDPSYNFASYSNSVQIIPEQLFKYYLHSLPNYSYRAKQLFLCLFITNTEIIKDDNINPEGRIEFCHTQNISKINIDIEKYNKLSNFTKLTIANMFIDIINEYILNLDICCIND
jgi:hypothetical protein